NGAIAYLKFGPGIAQSDLAFSRQGQSNDLTISIKGTDDQVTIVGQFDAGYGLFGPTWLDRIEGFKFADGASMSWDQVIETLDAQAKGQPVIYGFDYPDALDPGPGVHYLSGGNESNTYIFDFGYSYDVVENATTNILSGMSQTIAFGPAVTRQD